MEAVRLQKKRYSKLEDATTAKATAKAAAEAAAAAEEAGPFQLEVNDGISYQEKLIKDAN